MLKAARCSIAVILIVSLVTSCTTMVNIGSDPQGARVSINGLPVGTTPHTEELSDFVFNTYSVKLELDGYDTVAGELPKEFKAGPFVAGFFVGIWPWLWMVGPKPFYHFNLVEE